MELTPIDDEGRLFVSSRIDDWRLIDAHDMFVVVDLESTLGTGIPSGEGTRLYLYYPFNDEDVPDPTMVGPIAVLLAQLHRGGHRVLVHCLMGLNRSPLVAGAVLHHLGWSGSRAIERLRECRPGALFNDHYSAYLERLGSRGEPETHRVHHGPAAAIHVGAAPRGGLQRGSKARGESTTSCPHIMGRCEGTSQVNS